MDSNIYKIEDFIKAINYINISIKIIDSLIKKQIEKLKKLKIKMYDHIFSKNGRAIKKNITRLLINEIEVLVTKYFENVDIETIYNSKILSLPSVTDGRKIPKKDGEPYSLITTYIIDIFKRDISDINNIFKFYPSNIANKFTEYKNARLNFLDEFKIQENYYTYDDNDIDDIDMFISSSTIDDLGIIQIKPIISQNMNPELSQRILSNSVFISLLRLIYKTSKDYSFQELEVLDESKFNLDIYKKVTKLYEITLRDSAPDFLEYFNNKIDDSWLVELDLRPNEKKYFCLSMVIVNNSNNNIGEDRIKNKNYSTKKGKIIEPKLTNLNDIDNINKDRIIPLINKLELLPYNYSR